MRNYIHHIKNYNERRKPRAFLLADTLIFRLIVVFMAAILAALGIYVLDRIYWKSDTYILLPFWVLLLELLFVPGFLQLELLRKLAKDSAFHPHAPTRSFRTAAKRERLRDEMLLCSEFGNTDIKSLIDDIMEQWSWRRSVLRQVRLSRGVQTRALFRPPSSANSLTLLSIIVGAAVTFIVALTQETDHFQSLPQIIDVLKTMFYIALNYGLIPFAAFALLIPTIWNGLRNSGISILETIDDDYLSDKTLFAFINEAMEIHEAKIPRLRLRTAARVYWCIRILTEPMSRLSIVIRQARKSGRIGKLRRKQRQLFL